MPNYTERSKSIWKPVLPTEPADLERLRRSNNPSNEEVGDFTGRCRHCGSSNLWDDNLSYGCNSCGALL